VKMTFFSGYVHRFSLPTAYSGCDSALNPLTCSCERHSLASAVSRYACSVRHPPSNNAFEIAQDRSQRFGALWSGHLSFCHNVDGRISPPSLVGILLTHSAEPFCPCAIGAADVWLQPEAVACACPHTDIVKMWLDLPMRKMSQVGGAIVRINSSRGGAYKARFRR
jgi:hypothetical protein